VVGSSITTVAGFLALCFMSFTLGLDLGIVMALVSSFKNRAIDEKTVIFGEVGLAGEVRAVSQAQQRVNEAVKLGFKTCILPGVCLKNIKKNDKIEIIGVNNVQEAIKLI